MIKDGDFTDEQLLLTTVQAAKVLAVGRTTIFDLIKHGELRAVHISRSLRISWAELERFVTRLDSGTYEARDDRPRSNRHWRRVVSPEGHRILVHLEAADQRNARS